MVVVDMLIGVTIVVGLTVMQDVPLNRMVALRASLVGVAPIVVMLLNPLVPSHIKAVFVFWRLSQVLPGHRAFSHHALADVRIDVTKLKKNAGAFPETPKDQNTKWYSLFKKVENDPAIEQVHKQFLLLRDLAMLSILLLICSLIAWGLGLLSSSAGWSIVCLFAVQYLLCAIGARFQGNGLVCSVLALHSVKRRV